VTADNAVVDASVLVRAAVAKSTEARTWVQAVELGQVRAFAPELVWIECASAFRRYVSAEAMALPNALQRLERILELPILTHPLEELAQPALEHAVRLGLSVYDASYVVLAESADAVLVTADQRLAGSTKRAELVV
jgi:predicted nucleic acid-binding protein